MPQKPTFYCCVPTCRNSSKTKPENAFFCLPANKKRRNKWLRSIGREDLTLYDGFGFKYYTVCEDHFGPGMISTSTRNYCKRLTPNAKPTTGIPDARSNQNNLLSVGTQTEITDKYLVQKIIQQHRKQSNQLPITIEALATYKIKLENMSKMYTSKEFTELIKCYEKVCTASSCPEFYADDYRQYCLNLYYESPRTYRLLQSTIKLPNLRPLLESVPITTKTNELLLNALLMRVQKMTMHEVQCMLVIDTMPLTQNISYNDEQDKIVGFQEIDGDQEPFMADKALVMMLHGMFSDWQLPVGYAFIFDLKVGIELAHWMNDVFKKLFDIGLVIRSLSFASELEAEFFERLWINNDEPYFFIKKKKVYFISDPKTMLNALRNDLSLYNIQFDNNRVAKFEHIEEFYNKDKDSQFRLAPKLTREHVYSSSNPSNATELFSKTVASGLSAYVDCKLIEKEARDTVELILKISDIIELFNSSNATDPNKRIFCDVQNHIQKLMEMENFIKSLRTIDRINKQDVTDFTKFVRGFLINIKSYRSLFEDLMLQKNTHLPVKILNQGLTEGFFKEIRLKCDNATKPTAEQFTAAYKQLYITKVLSHFKARNAKEQQETFFIHAKRALLGHRNADENLDDVIDLNMREDEKIVIPLSDFNHIDRSERHTLLYVSGYLLKKCKERHRDCESFRKYVEGTSENITINHVSRYLLYSQRHQICFMAIPCNHFIIIVEQLEDVFRSTLKNNHGEGKLVGPLCENAKQIDFGIPPCPCFPWEYFMKLFFKIRINYTLKLNNRELERGQKFFVIPLLLSDCYALNLPKKISNNI